MLWQLRSRDESLASTLYLGGAVSTGCRCHQEFFWQPSSCSSGMSGSKFNHTTSTDVKSKMWVQQKEERGKLGRGRGEHTWATFARSCHRLKQPGIVTRRVWKNVMPWLWVLASSVGYSDKFGEDTMCFKTGLYYFFQFLSGGKRSLKVYWGRRPVLQQSRRTSY